MSALPELLPEVEPLRVLELFEKEKTVLTELERWKSTADMEKLHELAEQKRLTKAGLRSGLLIGLITWAMSEVEAQADAKREEERKSTRCFFEKYKTGSGFVPYSRLKTYLEHWAKLNTLELNVLLGSRLMISPPSGHSSSNMGFASKIDHSEIYKATWENFQRRVSVILSQLHFSSNPAAPRKRGMKCSRRN